MDESILDTDILSEVLKKNDQQVLTATQQYLSTHGRLAYSAITVYEIVRGMRAKRATRQLANFLTIVSTSDVLAVSMPVLMRASELRSEARNAGHPHNDTDLIIAATALEADRQLVTGNTSHFSWIGGLRLADWRQPQA